jgi:hypothetical protein
MNPDPDEGLLGRITFVRSGNGCVLAFVGFALFAVVAAILSQVFF